MSEVAFLGFVEKILGGAPGERHDRERRIFVRVGNERRAIRDEKILHIVRLAEAIEHGGFRISAHARGAHLVNNFAAFLNPEKILSVDGGFGPIFTAHGFDDGAKRLLHVLGLEQFVIRPPEMEAQRGNAPPIDDVGIDLAVGLRVGNHFAAAGEADVRAVDLASALLQAGAVAFFLATQFMKHADAGQFAPPAKFDVIAAGKIILAAEFPPRHVHVHAADTVVIVGRHLLELREVAITAAADGIGEVLADRSGRVGEAGWKGRGFGVQQETRGFAGAGGHDDGARVDALFRARRFVNVGDGFGFAFLVDENFAGHRAGNQRQFARFHCRRKQNLTGAEIRGRDAAAAALAAVMARQSPVERARNDGEARGNADDVELVASLLDHQFGAAGFGRRQEDAVGGAGDIFFRSEHADVGIHFVVIRREILVSDGPIVAETIARGGFEIDGSEAQRDAAPVIGAAADDAGTKPLEIRAGSGGVGLAFDLPRAIRREKFTEVFARLAADAGAAVRQIVRPQEHLEILVRSDVRPGFEEHAVQAALGENLRGHASARTGADNANVILLWRANHLRHAKPAPYRLFFLSSETAKSQARAVRAM